MKNEFAYCVSIFGMPDRLASSDFFWRGVFVFWEFSFLYFGKEHEKEHSHGF